MGVLHFGRLAHITPKQSFPVCVSKHLPVKMVFVQISSFQAVNQRYRRTVWDSYSGYVNMGFTIDEVSASFLQLLCLTSFQVSLLVKIVT